MHEGVWRHPLVASTFRPACATGCARWPGGSRTWRATSPHSPTPPATGPPAPAVEGLAVDPDVVRRRHALTLVLFCALPSLPLDATDS
ncbi:hypothetical protein [Nocardioides sp. P5_C9_2]